METLPRISVITPSFNQAPFIEQTISSVISQDYPNLEYIIIDGGSTDGSLEIIRKFQGNIAYWVSEKDRGQAHAINKGLQRATGDIIAYLNSDDYYLNGTLARVAKQFIDRPKADLFHGRCRIVDERCTKIDVRCGSITRYEEILDLWSVWWKRRNFVQPEVFWTKRIADRIGPFREDLFWVMDYEYWLRILRAKGEVRFVDAELAAFRLHPKQKSTQSVSSVTELLNVVRPSIFSSDLFLTPSKRSELKGKWIYQARFLEAVRYSMERKEKCWRRWLRLAWLSVRNPRVFQVRAFRERLYGVLTVWAR
jgi:glycosyltransferase involved in cell wall biosynthesis